MKCKHCKIEKLLSEFYTYKGKKFEKYGKLFYKKVCKKCSWAYYGASKEAKRWGDFRSNAKRRGFKITLTKDEFLSFWNKPCHYCGDITPTTNLDRSDSSKGYLLDNVLTCCPPCNYMKMLMTEEQFYEQCFKILRFNNLIMK